MIVASSDPDQIGKTYGSDLNLEAISKSPESFWRILSENQEKTTFEFYRRFAPTHRQLSIRRGRSREDSTPIAPPMLPIPPEVKSIPRIIFIGLDMESIEEARHTDAIHTVIMGTILLLSVLPAS